MPYARKREHAPLNASTRPPLVAYFSMEYGLHEEFHSYAGGLGVLAGDFMKSAGDLGLPVVGIGLRWGQGYTSQHIGADGYPHDEWTDQKPYLLEPTDPRDLWITRRLYDPRPDCRVAQEMLLGIGGVRALRALHLPVEI